MPNYLKTLALITASFFPSLALGQEVPIPIDPASAGTNEGTLESITAIDLYSVKLALGQLVAVAGKDDAGAAGYQTLNRDRSPIFYGSFHPGQDGGTEYKAPAAGTYFVRIQDVSEEAGRYPVKYSIWIDPDCPSSRTGACGVDVGVWQERIWSWLNDMDYMKVSLTSGKTTHSQSRVRRMRL